MPKLLSRYATPLVTGLFIVSLVSGVALFFHLGSAYFHSMHEWLSMVLIAPFALHIWKNWRSFLNYFKRPPMAVASLASLAAALVFVVPMLISGAPSGRPVPPEFAAARAMTTASITDVAPVFGHDGEGFADALRANGYTVVSSDQTLDDVAAASGKTSRDILAVLPGLKAP